MTYKAICFLMRGMKYMQFCIFLTHLQCEPLNMAPMKRNGLIPNAKSGDTPNLPIPWHASLREGTEYYQPTKRSQTSLDQLQYFQMLTTKIAFALISLLCPLLNMVGQLLIQNARILIVVFAILSLLASLYFLYNDHIIATINKHIQENRKEELEPYKYFWLVNKDVIIFYVLKILGFMTLVCVMSIFTGFCNKPMDGKMVFLFAIALFFMREHYLLYQASKTEEIDIENVKLYCNITIMRSLIKKNPSKIEEITKLNEASLNNPDNQKNPIYKNYKFSWILLDAFAFIGLYSLFTCVNISFFISASLLFPLLVILAGVVLFVFSGRILSIVFIKEEDEVKEYSFFNMRELFNELRKYYSEPLMIPPVVLHQLYEEVGNDGNQP